MTRRILADEEQPAGIPGWALTYIDLLWLLLLFFILRSAVGEIGRNDRFREITAALKKRFGAEAAATAGENEAKKTAPAAIAKDRNRFDEIVREGFEKNAAADRRSLAARGAIYFSDGELELRSEQKQILQAVAVQIGPTSDAIEIRGETAGDAVRAEKTGDSAVDPAYARCIAARNYLVKLGIEPRRLRIALGGEKRRPGERPRLQLYSVAEIAEMPGKAPKKR